MCGRYQIALPGHTLASMFDATMAAADVQPTWNAAPTQVLPVLALGDDGALLLQGARWGLVPTWPRPGAAGAAPSRPLINARVETVAEKASFRAAVRHGRILVPTTGFYEWSAPADGRARGKVPHAIRVRGPRIDPATGAASDIEAAPGEPASPFLLAGIAAPRRLPDGTEELTYAVLTTEPNELCAPIHDRMPVILDGDDAQAWLHAPASELPLLLDLARPFPSERMEEWTVSSAVNGAGVDGPQLAVPVPEELPELRLL